MSARQPGWRRASAPSQRSIGSSSASSPSIWPSATASACRLAGGSATPSSQPRVARDSSSWLGRGSPWWNKAAWMRCCQAVRWSTRVLRSRTVVRRSKIHAGGIHEPGSRPCSSSSRSSRASDRSVLARRLGPRRLLVSAGSARWARNPAAWSSSATNRQPVHPSTANAPSAPGSSPSQTRIPARVAGAIRPRWASPLSRSTQSKVICRRCTSNPPMMLIGTSFELRPRGQQHDHPCLSRRGSLHMSSFQAAVDRLDEITGVGRIAAQVIIAEIGLDMGRFATPAHLASWARYAPGVNQSAGKTKGKNTTGHGNPYLARVLGEAAVVAGRTDTFLGERYRRIARRRGTKKAIVAVGRSILIIVWHLLADPTARYHDLGAGFYDTRINPERAKRNHIRQLEALGYKVTLEPAA